MNRIPGPVNDVERRYQEDTMFRCVVDSLHAMVARADLTPSGRLCQHEEDAMTMWLAVRSRAIQDSWEFGSTWWVKFNRN